MPNTGGKALLRASLLTLAISSAAFAQQQRDTTFTWSKSLPAGARLSIRNVNGPIEVRAGSSDRVEVQAVYRLDSRLRPGDIAFEVREASANDVELCTIDRGQNACETAEDMEGDNHVSVRYLVDLPEGMRFQAMTGNGSIVVMQAVSEVDVRTGNGDVVIRESESKVSASTGSGRVTVAMGFGPVSARSGNGDVLVNMAYGRVDASSGNGDVEVRLLSVAPQAGSQPMSITSGNGDVHVTLPADFNGVLNADSGNGKVTAEFDVRASRTERTRLRGTVGSGNGPTINVHSGNGRVEIRKG